MDNEKYLGDGLYASTDGWQFKLRAPRDGSDHVVYLEPGTLDSFLHYVSEVRKGQALSDAIDDE